MADRQRTEEQEENLELLESMKARGMFGEPDKNGCRIEETNVTDWLSPQKTPPQPPECKESRER